MDEPKFEVDLHHGGHFFVDRKFGNDYIGGRTKKGLEFEFDRWSLQEITAILKDLGYKGYAKIWYREPGRCLNMGLKELKSDADCVAMAKFVCSTALKKVEIFVATGVSASNGIEVTSNDSDYEPSENDVGSETESVDDSLPNIKGHLKDGENKLQGMAKEANLKGQMRIQDKDNEHVALHLGNVRSSHELLKKFNKIKREKMVGNKQQIRPPTKLFKISAIEHEERNGQLDDMQHTSQMAKINQPKPSTQKQDPKNIKAVVTKGKESTQNNNVKVATQSKGSGQYDNAKAATQSKGLGENNNGKAATQSKGSGQYDNAKAATQSKGSGENNNGKAATQSKGSGQYDNAKAATQSKGSGENNNGKAATQSKGSIQKQDLKRDAMKKALVQDGGSSRMLIPPKKKAKPIPMFRPMSIDEFLKENEDLAEEEEHGHEDEEQNDIEKEKEIIAEEEGTSKKRTRGPTQCLRIHARSFQDRQEIIFDDHGGPIGPNSDAINGFTSFIGTLARNADFCPLIYINFKALKKENEDRIWEYVNEKFIIPEANKKAVFHRLNTAWRRHKTDVKKLHFLAYPNLRERLKNRPETIPEDHFRQLIAFWSNENVQRISLINAANRAKQKYRHRMGRRNFSTVRAKLLVNKKDGEDVTQTEMFIATRQSQKGKEVDEETQTAISKLKDSIQNSSESGEQAFQSLFGKEKPGRVRCFGGTITPTMFKRNQEMAAVKRQHYEEMNSVNKKVEGLQTLVKYLLKDKHPELDNEALDNMMANALGNGSTNAQPHSSGASTSIPNYEKHYFDGGEEDHPQDIEDNDMH